ncbi:MAG: transcriptional regulator [Deltaproteobacteria bacterium]|nr:transcriptional regulator [Deltaproteobacteria bacterium]
MQAAKKVEIICDSVEVKNVIKILESNGISGYTIIRDVIGKGGRGMRAADDLTDVFKNSWILTVCSPEQVGQLVEAIRPILKKFGGICLVTDTNYVIH